jgi:uncharacterized protein involved in outer membrane biogenesis
MKNTKKHTTGVKKWFLGTVLVLILVIAGAVLFVLTRLDYIVKIAIEKYGSRATGTAIRVESVRIRLRQGSAAIQGLTIANPDGFETPHAFSLGETGVKIDVRSITKEVKIIDEILVRAPEIFVETNAARSVNLNELKKNLEKAAPPDKSSTAKKKGEKGPEPKLIIRRILFSEGAVHVKIASGGGRQYELRLPSVEMTNLGGSQGATPDQLTRQILGELSRRALGAAGKKAAELAVDKAKDAAKSLLDRRKGSGFLK